LPLNNKGKVLAGAVEGCRWSRERALQAGTTQQRGSAMLERRGGEGEGMIRIIG